MRHTENVQHNRYKQCGTLQRSPHLDTRVNDCTRITRSPGRLQLIPNSHANIWMFGLNSVYLLIIMTEMRWIHMWIVDLFYQNLYRSLRFRSLTRLFPITSRCFHSMYVTLHFGVSLLFRFITHCFWTFPEMWKFY